MLNSKCFMTFQNLSQMPGLKAFKENLLNEKHPSHSKILLGLRIRPNVT